MSSNSSNALTGNHDEVSDSNVSDFLKRLENLKQTKDSEEKNRVQRLEEEIEEAKRQRLARRLALSRSVSPEKFALSTSSANLRPPRSVVSVWKELATESKLTPNHSFDTSPSLPPTHVVAQNRALERGISKNLDTSSPKQIRPEPKLQATPMLRTFSSSPILGQDAVSVKIQSNSPASKLSSPLAFKSTQISTMEKIKMWEKSVEIEPTAPIIVDEPTVVPMPKADDIESRGKKELEREDLSVSRLETSVDLSSRENESSSSSLATELLTQSESNIDDVKTAQSQARTVNEAARQESGGAKSTLSRRTSTINLSLSTTTASQSQSGANVEKEKDVSDREEERLSKFLRGPRQRSPQKDRLRSNYTPLLPSPSMHHSRSPSPSLSPINEHRKVSHLPDRSISGSPSHSPERFPTRDVQSPFRSNRYSGIGTFASSDFYNEGSISPASFELGLKNLPSAIDLRRTDSVRSTSSVASSESSYLAESPFGFRSSSPGRPKSPTKVGFVQSAMLKRDGSHSPTKRLSMGNLRPAPAVLNSTSSSPLQKSQEWQDASDQKSVPISATVCHPQLAVVDERTAHDKLVWEQGDGEPNQKNEPELQKVEDGQALTPLSKTITPVFYTPDNSPSLDGMRNSPSLHRSTSSLTMTRSAVERFRARDLDLTAKYDKERENSIVSQYSESNFKPSPTSKSLLDIDSEEDDSITVRRSRGIPKGHPTELGKKEPACAETGNESNKENVVVDGSSTERPKTPILLGSRESTPKSPLLTRSPSRSPNNKRWTPSSNKSSWLETALMKTGPASMRAPAGKSPKDLFS